VANAGPTHDLWVGEEDDEVKERLAHSHSGIPPEPETEEGREVLSACPSILRRAYCFLRIASLAVNVPDRRQQPGDLIRGGALAQRHGGFGPESLDRPQVVLENLTVEEQQGIEGLVLGGGGCPWAVSRVRNASIFCSGGVAASLWAFKKSPKRRNQWV